MEVAVAGVPSHEPPAAPFGAPDAAPAPAPIIAARAPVARAPDPDRRQAYNDLPLPPRYARSRPQQDWGAYADDDDAYAPAGYGPRPSVSYRAWLPRPRRWSRASAYNGD